jgi:hypothetical protein
MGYALELGIGALAQYLILEYATVSAVTAGYSILGPTVMGGLYGIFGSSAITTVSSWIGPISISSLTIFSDSAATSATAAWFGGGALAGGGLGAGVGSAVMTGGIVIIGAAIASGIYYFYVLNDQEIERERVHYLVNQTFQSLTQ